MSTNTGTRVGTALRLLNEIGARPKVDDWGTKVLFVYETLWEALDNRNDVNPADREKLAKLLESSEVLLLVRNVIPEMRDPTEATNLTSPAKIGFMKRIEPYLESGTPGIKSGGGSDGEAVDAAMYNAEKNALYDADEYRTMLFLRRTERFNEKEMADIREWLRNCPVKMGQEEGRRDLADGSS